MTATLNKKAITLIAAFFAIFAMLSVNATPAFAAADVSGTVTDSSNSNTAIQGVTVTATKGATTVSETTGVDGTYMFAGLAAGDWVLRFSKSGYVTEWYNNKNTLASATAVTVASTAVTGLITRLAASVGSLQGKVKKRDAGNNVTAVEGAIVTLYKSGLEFGSTTTTDSEGSFTFSNLPAGTYTYFAESSTVVDGFYGGAATVETATTANLTSGNLSNKDVTLTASGTIAGTISDTNGGITNADVYIRTADGTYVDNVATNGSGVYLVTDLTPGNYFLEAGEASTHETVWWDSKLSFASAISANKYIPVAAGVNVTGKNVTLPISSTLTAIGNATTAPSVSGTPTEGLTLSASNGNWPVSGVEYNYFWQRSSDGTTFTDILSGRNKTYTLTADDYDKYIRVTVIAAKANYRSSGASSNYTARVAHSYTTLGTPTITGVPTVGQVLTIEEGTWVPTPTDFIYQWYHGGVSITNATSKTYTLTDASAGKAITATVTPVKSAYPTAGMTRTTAATALVGKAITVSPTPTITGTAAVGKVLTAVTGAWTPSNVSFTYQWLRSGTAISGATSSTYTPVAADLGYYITVTVTGNLTNYTPVSKTSSPTSAVLNKMTVTPTPTITGVTLVGNVLTVNPGVWTPSDVSLTYRWLRNNIAIPGATGTTYTLVQADDLTSITVRVTATKTGYGDEEKTSLPISIGKQFVNHNAPTLKGNNWVGQTLKATVGLWDAAATLTHQWYRDGVAILGATAHSYLLQKADIGHKITMATTGTATGYVSKTSTSAPTAVILSGIPFAKKPSPVITGTLKVGQTLGVKVGAWSPTPKKYYYQWLRNLVPITGATAKTYKLTAADLGTSIRVRVKVAKPGYATTAITSRPSVAIK